MSSNTGEGTEVAAKDLRVILKQITDAKREYAELKKLSLLEQEETKKIRSLREVLVADLKKQERLAIESLAKLDATLLEKKKNFDSEMSILTKAMDETRKQINSISKERFSLVSDVSRLEDKKKELELFITELREKHSLEIKTFQHDKDKLQKEIESLNNRLYSKLAKLRYTENRMSKIEEMSKSLNIKEAELLEKEKMLNVRDELTREMFQSAKTRYKKNGVLK